MDYWFGFGILIVIIAFGAWYPDYIKKSIGCSAVRGWRMLTLGGTGLFTALADKEHPIYFMVVLVFILIAVIVFLLNRRDSKSWLHGILMTLWQSLAAAVLIWFVIKLMNLGKDNKKGA